MARRLNLFTLLALTAVLAAACGGNSSDASDAAAEESEETEGTDSTADEAPATVQESAEGILTSDDERFTEYLEEASVVPLANSDASEPANLPTEAGGASGYTRYVFRENAQGEILTSLVEGPLGEQVRCQDPGLPCSYGDLKELADSGGPIPPELGVDAEGLDSLVAELDAAHGALEHYADPSTACADGFVSDRTQTPNMGTHFFNYSRITDGKFEAGEPEIVMYALADGKAPEGQLGQCEGGVWGGEQLEVVAVAYILFTGREGDHPEGFTGNIDNWHVHYNLCRGAGTDGITSAEECSAQGGQFFPTLGWMLHAWITEDYDNQLGVFSMWNPTIWPVSDPEAIHSRQISRPSDAPDDAAFLPIENFSFGNVEVEAGQPLIVSNSDSVAHTVTDGTYDDPGERFDSGVFAPGETFELTFDEAGEYQFFCALHPDMTATVTVN